MEIKFINTNENVDDNYAPKPAQKDVPFWYKKTPAYMGGEKMPTLDGKTTATVKKCMPVFDAMTSGYYIYSFCDVSVTQSLDETGEQVPYYSWPTDVPIGFHPIAQAEFHPAHNGYMYPKWHNPWGIKTPPGYSCLFIQPLHRESVFTIMPGVVDTDTYTNPVNFPFVLNDPKFQGIIPAGTPIAQVIPFKRDSWRMAFGNEEELKQSRKQLGSLRNVFFEGYKLKFRQPKEYR